MRNTATLVLIACLTLACSQRAVKPISKPVIKPIVPTQGARKEAPIQIPEIPANLAEEFTTAETKPIEYPLLKPAKWQDLDGFLQDDLTLSWDAWLRSCSTLKNKKPWQTACKAASSLNKPGSAIIADYFTQYFDVYSTANPDGTYTGMITGYYEPLLMGSRTQSARFPYPLYKQPSDLISVELSDIYPELKYKRIRGKLVGNKLLPYATRAEIETTPSPLEGNEIVWIDDIIDVFFLQVQGSGLVKLENGEDVHVGYADQNGHAYNSIGRLLVERGELRTSEASMQGIKNWARNNLGKLRELLNSNPSYVFFKELPAGLIGPLGALGVPLTAERSMAVDPKFIPLGAPLFLSTTQPNSTVPLKRLMMAQDTGGAIKGGVRADFYWGSGDAAGKQAGAMKQIGKIWVLLPKEYLIP
jgi:membrane-bound lytic murein transglycosylase A